MRVRTRAVIRTVNYSNIRIIKFTAYEEFYDYLKNKMWFLEPFLTQFKSNSKVPSAVIRGSNEFKHFRYHRGLSKYGQKNCLKLSKKL
jgi:hypothetical protein